MSSQGHEAASSSSSTAMKPLATQQQHPHQQQQRQEEEASAFRPSSSSATAATNGTASIASSLHQQQRRDTGDTATAPNLTAATSPNSHRTSNNSGPSRSTTTGSGGAATNKMSSVTPFRLKLLKQKSRKRKLGQAYASSSSSGSSSSGSEDEDDEAVPSKNSSRSYHRQGGVDPSSNSKTTASTSAQQQQQQQQQHHQQQQQQHQPEGWRVKLYRLNADGSWDDCGTGRIVCLYRPPPVHGKSSPNTTSTTGNTTGPGHDSNSNIAANTSNNNNNGGDQWLYHETGEATLCVHSEVTKQQRQPRVLLRTRILLRDAYQRQGDNIITWCEPYYGRQQPQPQNQQQQQNNNGEGGGVDLALSFQDNAGCLDIWRQITHVQSRAAELLSQRPESSSSASRSHPSDNLNENNHGSNHSVQDMAAQVAAQHHADLQRQQQHDFWAHLSSSSAATDNDPLNQQPPEGPDLYEAAAQQQHSLPNPPTLQNLEEIADTIAALQHIQQRESLALWIAKDDCSYLKALLELFPAAETRGDYGKLATLAACVKTILLLNEPSILELIVTAARVFEQVCSCLEYDPDLREKANHRWFLRERAKFRTVVPMDDPELVNAIHRSFRVNYLRDTLLRPTMDESSLSTLSSLQTFTHSDVVKGVTMSQSSDVTLRDSYLVRVIRILGIELHALSMMEWADLEVSGTVEKPNVTPRKEQLRTDPSIVVGTNSATWKQYLAPQDTSLASRRLRRRGSLSFLKELFNMVRTSLQQNDKDDFFSVICTLDVELTDDIEIADNVSQTSQTVEVGSYAGSVKSERLDERPEAAHMPDLPPPASPVNLLSLLGCVLVDPSTDATEKGAALEIIAGVTMHDPSLIRQHCLLSREAWKKEREAKSATGGTEITGRPDPNEKKQVLFLCPPNDLLASLLFLLAVETDAGVLLQVSEIMRYILDTDMMGDHGPMNAGFADEAEPPEGVQSPPHDQHNQPSGSGASSTDQKQFLSLFYEHYVEWLVAPFQFTVLYPVRRIPDLYLCCPLESPLMQRMMSAFSKGVTKEDPLFRTVPGCATRSSFAVELLSFCVRAHLYRMKFFLLKSRVLGDVLKLLRPHPVSHAISGDRCLKLAALRFLRAILSVNDEFYHRHIIQHNLFAPVFEAFRANPVGDNLVSSAIVEMCDYIHNENIKSLLEYIVTKHLSATPETEVPSLEDVSSPYVSTLTVLRKAYEANLISNKKVSDSDSGGPASPGGSRYFAAGSHAPRMLSGKALEDQRKFREVDEEESYFESDDDEPSTVVPPAVDEVAAQQGERELHRTPRMFSLAQAPLLNNESQAKDQAAEMGEEPVDENSNQGLGGKKEDCANEEDPV